MRRLFFGLVAALLLFPATMLSALAAQDATPGSMASPFADLGLPTLDITINNDGYQGIPDSLEAGRYLVTLTVAEDTTDNGGGGIAFVQPSGMTSQEFIDFLGQMMAPQDQGAAAATPTDGGMGTPAADSGGGDMGAPAFFYDSVLAGGAFAGPGQSVQIVVDLPPGDWVAWGDDPTAPQAPMAFTVTGEMPSDLPEPVASATISLGEYMIQVTDGQITTGAQVIRVNNVGAQPHFVFGTSGPDGLTNADVEAILQSDMTGTPVASGIDPETDFQDVFGTGTQSPGTSQWVYVPEVPAGPLVLLCFFPDQGDGMPHAFHGMYTIVEVGN